MISITVHHHNPHNSRTSMTQQHELQPQASAGQSNVQVQYLARYFRSSASKRQEKAELEPLSQVFEPHSEVPALVKPTNPSLHTRSISFVINPQFSEHSDAHTLCRRRSLPRLPRRARLVLPAAKSSQAQEPDNSGSDGSSSSSSTGSQTSELELTCSARLEHECCQAPKEQLLKAPTTPQSLERLRQTGVLLREISDEFFRSRRRTI